MPFDMTAVLFVADQDKYAQYRAEIAPLLNAIGECHAASPHRAPDEQGICAIVRCHTGRVACCT